METKHKRAQSLVCLAVFLAVASLTGCKYSDTARSRQAERDRGRARRDRDDGGLKVGDEAPVFKLKMLDDDTMEVDMAGFRETKPVVLFFGSYT